ncbi:hypothetical protein [Clostridium botulinum]|uniref:hypothetical protein n=1 Tax=Clostridium botulinum TaxID=1491 RepID=UPI0006A74D6B|nr:hypothetical protein [Clostridium botulinum]KAI3349982.1 hypothetical protein CIT18_05945 [Clostridium botulinum]KOM86584.1 hypothetical protein ACP51_17385 [Clostridium botulinum]KOR55318.1 hypothetical protein ADT22_17060 [Clostridium botulinum]NFE95945.1 hypothetical protein [Clostridium botulinum]NFL39428.1 hypothetical protein [Clostridium botulinum]
MNIEELWKRIKECEGEVFQKIKGGKFTYTVNGNLIILSSTNRLVSKSTFKKALNMVPLKNTVPVQNLQAPSYLYAILMDDRIKKNEW